MSLFIDAESSQIEAAKRCGAELIELHTGHYAEFRDEHAAEPSLKKLQQAATFAHGIGLQVNAGHGLHYHNVQPVAMIPEIVELNIGHALIARAVMVGLESAVKEMKRLMVEARQWQ